MKIAILQLLQRSQRDNLNPSLTAKVIYDLAFLWSNVQNVLKFNKSEKISIPGTVSCEFEIFLRDSPRRFFYFCFFHEQAPPKPFSRYSKAYRSWLQLRGDITILQLTLRYCLQLRVGTPRLIYDEESQLCISFIAESCSFILFCENRLFY